LAYIDFISLNLTDDCRLSICFPDIETMKKTFSQNEQLVFSGVAAAKLHKICQRQHEQQVANQLGEQYVNKEHPQPEVSHPKMRMLAWVYRRGKGLKGALIGVTCSRGF